MRHAIVDKTNTEQPSSGGYRDWKQLIADEAKNSCVYCCIHESQFGGIRNFHIEHYRPKSKFKDLINNIANLFYSCPICNTFKGNHWVVVPEDGNFDTTYYPDPSQVDYSDLIDMEEETYVLFGRNNTGRYLIQRLGLNRQQLIIERRKFYAELNYIEAKNNLDDLVEAIKVELQGESNPYIEVILQSFNLISEGTTEIVDLARTIPYLKKDEQKVGKT